MFIRDSDYVFIVCTPRYKDRSDRRTGGVGYEGDIITGEVFTGVSERKFIPLLRAGDWQQAAPTWLAGKFHLDFRGDPYSERSYADLLATVFKTRPTAPPLGKPPPMPSAARAAPSTAPPANPARPNSEPIKITGIIVDEIGTPRSDGTPGSALYVVPFRLSRHPPPEWIDYFVQGFDHPSMWTSMHRPGIASVRGDRVILSGTTVVEVEKYHRNTLLLALNEANQNYSQLLIKRHTRAEAERQRVEAHKNAAAEAAKRIKFDDD